MAKLTGNLIKAGLHIFVRAYERKNHKEVPVELVIVTGEVERDSNVLHVEFANSQQDKSVFGVSSDPKQEYNRYLVYLGDDGVRPYNYDDRCTQVFTTEQEVWGMIEMCAGRYPNFVCEDGTDIPSREVESGFDDYDYFE